jgi:hypothetical protein
MKRILNKIIAVGILVASPTLGLSAPPAAPQTTTTQPATGALANDYVAIVKSLMMTHQANLKALLDQRGLILRSLSGNPTPNQVQQTMQQQLKANAIQIKQEKKRFHAALNAAYRQYLKNHGQIPAGVTETKP